MPWLDTNKNVLMIEVEIASYGIWIGSKKAISSTKVTSQCSRKCIWSLTAITHSYTQSLHTGKTLTWSIMKSSISWDVMLCSLAEVYRCFSGKGTYCIHHQGTLLAAFFWLTLWSLRRRKNIPLKRRWTSTSLLCISSQQIALFIVTAVRTTNLTWSITNFLLTGDIYKSFTLTLQCGFTYAVHWAFKCPICSFTYTICSTASLIFPLSSWGTK